MKKIKVCLMVLAITVIGAAFFESMATAAQVTRIHSSQKYVYIDGTIAQGFVVGARVCFYTSSDEEITCGRIDQASESYASVRVNNRIAKKIRYGMEARLSEEKQDKKETTAPQACTDDSECGYYGYCVNGQCQQ